MQKTNHLLVATHGEHPSASKTQQYKMNTKIRNQEKESNGGNLSAKVVTSVGSTLSLSPRFGLTHPEQLYSVNG